MLLFLLAVGFTLLFSFVCSLAEATLLSVGQARVEALARSGSRAGQLLRAYKRDPDTAIAAILVLNTVAHTGGATVATEAFLEAFPGASSAWFAAGFVVAILALTEILPKTLGVVHANRLAVPIAYTIRAMVVGLRPMLVLTRIMSRLLTRNADPQAPSLDEIRILTSLGHSAGAFGGITATLIQNATRLRDVKAKDVMVPRSRVTFLSGADSNDGNLELVRKSGHSRFPYTPSGELDEVTGIVLAKELLFALRGNPQPDWAQLQIPVLIVPESATLNHVLRRFQSEKRHMAIVVDEYGSTQGLITLEDVLEEIVGEIEDELDTGETHLLERGDGSLLCRGSAETRKVFAKLGLEDVETSSQTLGGFVTELLERMPTAGEQVEYRGYRFEVTKANNRRVERVRIDRVQAPGGEDDAA
jgi:CBS domain containing-hemolysin-like protein